MRAAVEHALDEIRPSIQADGGDIELVDITDGIARVKLQGTCERCPGIHMTIAMTVEPMLKERVPGIRGVVAI